MNKFAILIIGLLLFASSGSAEKITYDEGVLILTDENHDLALSVFGTMLIDFYTPSCEHCKTLEPEYIKAAKYMHVQKPTCTFAKLNVDEAKAAAEKYRIPGYPTLLLIKDRRIYEYRGEHKKDSIVNWVKQALSPSYANITTAEELAEYKANSTVVPVFYGSHDEEAFRQFEEASKFFITTPSYRFLVAADPELAKSNGQSYNGDVIIYKKYDADEKVKNDFDAEELKVKVETSEFPIIANFDDRFAEKLFQNMLSALFLVVKGSDEDKRAIAELERVKHKIRGKIMIGLVDTNEKIGKKMLKFLSLDAKKLPAVRIVGPDNTDVGRFQMKTEITGENIIKFVNDYADGKLKATFKSQEIPANNDGPVKIVVGNTYRDIVFDESKDVIVEIYAPWCHYCQEFAPRWEEIGKRLSKSADLVIAKMDGTANDKPGGAVSSFPTILFYKANKKDHPEKYEGDHTIEHVIEFIKKQSTVKVTDSGPTGEFKPAAKVSGTVEAPPEDNDDDDDDDDDEEEPQRPPNPEL